MSLSRLIPAIPILMILGILSIAIISILSMVFYMMITLAAVMVFFGITVVFSLLIFNFLFNAGTTLYEISDEEEVKTQDDRIDELKQQYLRGELSDDEFERLLDLELDGPDEQELNFNTQYN